MVRKTALILILALIGWLFFWGGPQDLVHQEHLDAYEAAVKEFDYATGTLAVVGLADATTQRQKEIAAAATYLIWQKAYTLYQELTTAEKRFYVKSESATKSPMADRRSTYPTIVGMTDQQVLSEYESMRDMIMRLIQEHNRRDPPVSPTRKTAQNLPASFFSI